MWHMTLTTKYNELYEYYGICKGLDDVVIFYRTFQSFIKLMPPEPPSPTIMAPYPFAI